MRNSKHNKQTDLQECKRKIEALLLEYNCEVMSADEWSRVIILDKDTEESDCL